MALSEALAAIPGIASFFYSKKDTPMVLKFLLLTSDFIFSSQMLGNCQKAPKVLLLGFSIVIGIVY